MLGDGVNRINVNGLAASPLNFVQDLGIKSLFLLLVWEVSGN